MTTADELERRARFLRGLADLAHETGFTVIGCGGCGCCASRDCPALKDVGPGVTFVVAQDGGDAIEYRTSDVVGAVAGARKGSSRT